jgi:hypothetical protein
MKGRVLSLSAPVVLIACAANANVILVDYGSAAVAPSLGGTWNVIGGTVGGPLVDSTGAASGVSLSFGGDGWIAATVDQGPWPAGDLDWVDGDATADYTFNVGGETSTVVFSGLAPGALYRFDHVAARALGADRRADYLVNGAFADSTPNGDDFFSLQDGWTDSDILTWDSVAADGTGNIILTVTDVQNFGYITASRLELIPAPGVMAALAFAGLTGVRRRR